MTTYAYGRFESDEEFAAFQRKIEYRFHISDKVRFWHDDLVRDIDLQRVLELAPRGASYVIFRAFADAGRSIAEAVRNIAGLLRKGVKVLTLDTNFDNFPDDITQFVFKQTVEAIEAAEGRHIEIKRKLGIARGRPPHFTLVNVQPVIEEMRSEAQATGARPLTARWLAKRIGSSEPTAAALLKKYDEQNKIQDSVE